MAIDFKKVPIAFVLPPLRFPHPLLPPSLLEPKQMEEISRSYFRDGFALKVSPPLPRPIEDHDPGDEDPSVRPQRLFTDEMFSQDARTWGSPRLLLR